MFKKCISLVLVMVLLTSTFVGCGNTTTTTESTGQVKSTDKDKPVTITFWFPGQDKAHDDYFTNVVKEFEAANPGIKIENTILPTANKDVDMKLTAADLSGMYPDVFMAYLLFMGTRSPRGDFLDLTKYVDNWSDKDDIDESTYDVGRYKGKLFGLAFLPSPNVFVYRKDFFEESGLDPEKPPKTWDELYECAKKLTIRDANNNVKRAGLDLPALNVETFIKPLMRQGGSIIVDEEKGIPSFSDQGSIDAFNFILKLKEANISIPFDLSKKEDIPFAKGNSAMSFLNISQIKTLMAIPENKDKIGLGPVLENKNTVDFCGNRLFTIGAKSKYPDQSWKFIEFLMSKEQMLKRNQDMGSPIVRKSLTEEFMKNDPVFGKAILEYIKYGKGSENFQYTSLVTKYLENAYQEVYNKRKTSEQALRDAEASLNRELSNISSEGQKK